MQMGSSSTRVHTAAGELLLGCPRISHDRGAPSKLYYATNEMVCMESWGRCWFPAVVHVAYALWTSVSWSSPSRSVAGDAYRNLNAGRKILSLGETTSDGVEAGHKHAKDAIRCGLRRR